MGTRFGTVWGLTALAWIAVALAAAPSLRGARWRAAALFLPLGLVALEPAFSGHPSTQSPVALLFTANVVHVVAMAVWVGGLVALVAILPAATGELEAPERSRALAATLARFSPIALLCVAAILLTGLGQGYAYVRDLNNLLDTAYGRAVLIKLAIAICLLVPLGAHNRYRSVPRLRRIAAGGESPGRAGVVVRRALRSEVALLVVVLGVTAALAGYAPATAGQSGPFSASASLGPAELELTVDPARAGSNQVHLYLFDARSGAQFTRVRELHGDGDPARGVDRAAEPEAAALRSRPLHSPGRPAQRRGRLGPRCDRARLGLRSARNDGRGPGQVSGAESRGHSALSDSQERFGPVAVLLRSALGAAAVLGLGETLLGVG